MAFVLLGAIREQKILLPLLWGIVLHPELGQHMPLELFQSVAGPTYSPMW